MTTILAQLSDPHLRVGPHDQGSAKALLPEAERAALGDRHPSFTIVPEPPALLVHTADVAHVQPV